MSEVILATGSTDLARRVRIASDDQLTVIQPEQLPVGPAQLLALAPEPDQVMAVVMDVRAGNGLLEHALDLASRFEAQNPSVGVLLVSDHVEELALRALRSGVRDVIEAGAEVGDIRWALRRAVETAQRTEGSGPGDHGQGDAYAGRVITVASPKGGVGKTTVATNLARSLSDRAPSGTVLVDLDVQFGDVAAALDLNPEFTVADLLDSATLSDPIALKTLLTRHPSGLQVACGVTEPHEADKLAPEKVGRLIDALKGQFRYVVLDTAPGLSDHTLTALDHATDLVLVTSLDVPGVRGLHKEIQVLDQLGLQPHTRHVIVNNVDRLAGLTIGDVETTIGCKVDLAIPRTAAVLRSTNVGSPVVEHAPRERVSRELTSFAGRFLPVGVHGERSRWRRSR